jgi:ATP-dependent Clp protease adaptor protein ClpS
MDPKDSTHESRAAEPPETPPAPPAAAAQTDVQERPAHPRLDRLPQYRVLLHNDEVNDMAFVVESICDLTPLAPQRAAAVMLEAHRTGVALMLVTHRERAELYVDLFNSRKLTVTMEPAE